MKDCVGVVIDIRQVWGLGSGRQWFVTRRKPRRYDNAFVGLWYVWSMDALRASQASASLRNLHHKRRVQASTFLKDAL